MMVYILPILGIILTGLGLWGAFKCLDADHPFIGSISLVLGIILLILTIIGSVNALVYMDYKANEPARIEMRIEERNVLNTMVGEIGTLMENDVTASSTYLTIYEDVVNFNKNVREADTWTGTIWEGILCDPSYAGLDVIPLN